MIANELIVLNAKKQICNYSMFKDDIFSHEIEALRKISLLSVIKLETSDFVFVFCFFLQAIIYLHILKPRWYIAW